MCGRARCTVNPQQIASACGISQTTSTLQFDRYRPSYNVSPGAYLPVVRRGGEGAPTEVIHCMKWGLVPSFTKKSEKPDHFRMFNARSESVKESASFRRLIPNNRCLVVIEGFYEWKKDGSKKQPYYIHFKDDQPLVLAALYDSWENSEGDALYTFTILTTGCSSALQWLHDRMPVILGDKDSIASWLGNSQGKLESILRPYEDPDLVWYPVTPAIGKTTFDVPECVKEINLKPVAKNPISKFFAKKIDNKCQLEPGSQKTSKSSLLADVEEESDALESKEVTKKKCKDSDAFPSLKNEPTDAVAPGIKREFEEVETDAFQQRNEPIDTDAPVINRRFAEVTTDSGPTPERNSSLPKSPVKKKGRSLQSSGGKQATLLSYFGKA